MSFSNVWLMWRSCTNGHLLLQVDASSDNFSFARTVPFDVMEALTDDGRVDVTDDPAADLIRAESRCRLKAAHIENTTAQLYTMALSEVSDVLGYPPTQTDFTDELLEQAMDPARPPTLLRTALNQFVASCEVLSAAHDRVRAIRAFVLNLDLPGVDAPAGLLAGAQSGWRRDPATPRQVSTYASEEVFVAAKPRRRVVGAARALDNGMNVSDGTLVAGEVFGVGWRRDGDDDDPYTDEPAVLGPWQLGYIPATGEIYATRRCHYRDPQVWLLARGHTNPEWTRRLLGTLKRRMGEPNSLLLVADALRVSAGNDPHFPDRQRGRRRGGGQGRGSGGRAPDVRGDAAGSGWG
ncbi:hypothetical protein [Actinophytocola glycyrrhizae]|uniref:DUF4238 domain-containing protein n=1 Tax=Actinophytocola glycyrrhizae TaxID=2044873 RepID=A0ABV9SBU5_9PSEU